MTLRGDHWARLLVFLIVTCTLVGALIGRQGGVAVGIFIGVPWAVVTSAATGVMILRAQRQHEDRH